MKHPEIPENEKERLSELKRLKILDTEAEDEFDEITKLAATICDVKIALISLVDEKRQWFKSRFGLEPTETPRDISFCGHAILSDKVFEVPNAELNPDFCDNPLFLGEPHVRFYAGAPLITKGGHRIGTLCVIDDKEKHLNSLQKRTLEALAKQVVGIMELKISQLESQFMQEQLERAQEISKIGSWQFNLFTSEQLWSKEHYRIFEIEGPQPQDKLYSLYRERIHPEDLPRLDYLMTRAVNFGEGFAYEHRISLDGGSRIKYVQGIGRVISDSSGKPVLLTGTCHDVTATVESEVKFKTIMNSMNDGLVVQNSLGEIVQFNPAALRILGLDESQLLGRTSMDPKWKCKRPNGEIFPGNEHPAIVALRTGITQKQVPMVVEKSDGSTGWINITAVPILKSGEGIPSSVIVTFSDMTEVQKIQTELEHTVNFVPAGIYRTDSAGSCISVNNGWCHLSGITPAEAMGLGWVDALHPEDKEKVFSEWSKSVAEDRPFELDYRFLHKSGKIVYVQGRAKAIKDPAGVITGYLGSLQDITNLKEVEEFNTFYKIALDKVAIVAMTDPRGKINYVNEMFCLISGYSRYELIGKDHRILNSGNMGKQFFTDMWKTISSGNQWNGKLCNRAKSGKEYWVDTTIIPFKGTDGKISRYIAIRRDITNEKLQENEISEKTISLEALKTRLELALKNSDIGVWEWEIQNNKLIWDDQMFKIYGVKKAQFTNAYDAWLNGLHPEDRAAAEEVFKLALDGKKEFDTEFRVIKPSGKISHVMGRGKVVRNSFGDPIKMIGINWDITKIKENEKALEKAKQTANESSKAKSDFLSTMSHEIRTPLNGVIGMTDLLLDSRLEEGQRELANAISQSGKTLLTIINDILDFSKIEAGKLELEISEFDLGNYLRELLKSFNYSAQKKGISFKFDSSENSNCVFADEGRIGQIVNNLVSNAIKFTKSGGVRVELKIEHNETSTDVKIFIHDTGIGIPEYAKDRMFQAFTQAEQSTSRHFGGTGLGLSISKRLTEMMGGTISFESEYGKGTTFKVQFRFQTGREIVGAQSPIQSQEQGQIQSLHGRILVAEDNITNQIVISRMLERFGCKVQVVANGNEVLDALRNSQFDLILMDCQMPEMDGYAATRIIRESETLPNNIKIIALTANTVMGDKQKCYEAGMNDYLSKPINLKALESVLRKYLMESQSGPTLIDKNYLKQFDDLQADGLPDILVETIESFLKTSPPRVSIISEYTKQHDVVAASREAHALKSSAMILGAIELGKLCQQIEDLSGVDAHTELARLVAALTEVYKATCIELSQIRDSQKLNGQKRAA